MATAVSKSLSLLRAPGNSLGFLVRSRLRWSRGQVAIQNEDKAGLFAWLAGAVRAGALAREADMRRAFDLAALREHSSVLHYSENLAMLDALTALLGDVELPVGGDGALRAVDVGSGVFQYATALHRFLARGGAGGAANGGVANGGAVRRCVLRGIEVDGHGIYRDGHSRRDHARSHATLAGADVRYEVADFTAMALPEQDVVTLWFPFVSRYALLRWGLPLSLFRPRRLFARAVAALRPGGLLVVANQTEAEFVEVQRLLAGAPVRLLRQASLRTDLVPYGARTEDRVGSVWRVERDDAAPRDLLITG